MNSLVFFIIGVLVFIAVVWLFSRKVKEEPEDPQESRPLRWKKAQKGYQESTGGTYRVSLEGKRWIDNSQPFVSHATRRLAKDICNTHHEETFNGTGERGTEDGEGDEGYRD